MTLAEAHLLPMALPAWAKQPHCSRRGDSYVSVDESEHAMGRFVGLLERSTMGAILHQR